ESERSLCPHPDIHLDTVLTEVPETFTVNERKGILDSGDHFRHTSVDKTNHTRSGPPGHAWTKRAARLERAIHRGAARARTGHVQSFHLGVRRAGALMMPVADDHAVWRNDDRADHRIGARPPASARRVEQRALHVVCGGQQRVTTSL